MTTITWDGTIAGVFSCPGGGVSCSDSYTWNSNLWLAEGTWTIVGGSQFPVIRRRIQLQTDKAEGTYPVIIYSRYDTTMPQKDYQAGGGPGRPSRTENGPASPIGTHAGTQLADDGDWLVYSVDVSIDSNGEFQLGYIFGHEGRWRTGAGGATIEWEMQINLLDGESPPGGGGGPVRPRFILRGRRMRQHFLYPEIQTGYELNPEKGFFSVILPYAATNYIENPSLETGTTGYAANGGASISRVSSEQKRGVYSLEVTPSDVNADEGVEYTLQNAIAAGHYYFSLDIKGRAGDKYRIWVEDGGGGIAYKAFRGTGAWERHAVPYDNQASATRVITIERLGGDDATNDPFYIDGLQLEDDIQTTYIDGDLKGFVNGKNHFYWNGTPHASTSFRSGNTRAGGEIVNLKELGFDLLAFVGLGMLTVSNIFTPLALTGGAHYQRTIAQPTQFNLAGALAGRNLQSLMNIRADLVEAFRPDSVPDDQPIVLRFQHYQCTDPAGDPVELICTYDGGLEGNIDNLYQERVAPQFTLFLPYLYKDGESGQVLTDQEEIAADYVIHYNGLTGQWDNMDGGVAPNGIPFPDVRVVYIKGNNDVYVGGAFSEVGSGALSAGKIARYDIGSETWSTWGSGTGLGGTGDNLIYSIIEGPDGDIYIGGSFTSVDGDGTIDFTARWDGSSWNALGANPADFVGGMRFGPDGNLYVAIRNTGSGAVQYWDGSSWTTLGSTAGGGDLVYDVEVDEDGNIYAGGDFTSIGGVSANNIAMYDQESATWVALGTGMNDVVRTLEIDPAGNLYAGGDFSTAGGVTVNNIARWNGTGWFALGDGTNDDVRKIRHLKGQLYITGAFTTAGDLDLADRTVIWNGSDYVPLPVDFPGTATVWDLIDNPRGDLIFGYNTGTATANTVVSKPNTVTNDGSASTNPIIEITRSGGTSATLIQIANLRTGKKLNFDLDLLDGETLTIDLRRDTIFSDYRSNLLPYLLPASDFADFELLPGDNIIEFYLSKAGAPTITTKVRWREALWSVDAATFAPP